MSKRQWLMIFGVGVIILLFLGFPASWNKIIAVILGLLICIVAFRLEKDTSDNQPSNSQISYVEHKSERSAMREMKDVNVSKPLTNPNSPSN